MVALTHVVGVDWAGDGTFAGTGEDVVARVNTGAGISAERGRNQIEPLSPPVAGDQRYELRNDSGDYSPKNAASPLYGLLDAGKWMRWAIVHGVTTYEISRAVLARLQPHSEWGNRTVGLAGLGQIAQLIGKTGFSSQLYGDGTEANGIYTGTAMGYLYDAAGITDPALRRFDTGKTRLLFWYIRPDRDLFEQAIALWAAEGPGAEFYDAPDGPSVFLDRHRKLLDARSTATQATFRDVPSGSDPFYLDLPWDYDEGDQHVVNVCTLPWKRRAIDAADAVIWELGSTVTLVAGESRSFPVAPTTGDPIASVVALVAGTDYTVSSGSLSGAPAFDRTSGPFVTLTLTAGSTGVAVTGLQVRGRLARVVAQAEIQNTIDTSVSRGKYGKKPFNFPTVPEITFNTGLDFCNAVVSQHRSPRFTASFHVPVITDVQATASLPREIADRVAVVNAREGLNATNGQAHVEWVKWTVPAGKRTLEAVFGIKQVVDAPYATWGGGRWGSSVWGF